MGHGHHEDSATLEGKLFLCVVLDLYSKLAIGWSIIHRQDRQMVIRAVEMAIWQRYGDWSVILHSDRDSQFTGADYQRFVSRYTLICSMSAVEHCGDNAACEGLFRSTQAGTCCSSIVSNS